MRARVEWTTTEERQSIIDEALGVLEKTGIRLGFSQALTELEEAGAHVDRQAGFARLPRDLVERTIAHFRRRILLAGATPDDDCLLEDDIHFLPSGGPATTLDFETGEYRSSTLEDLRKSIIVADAMSVIDILWPLVCATDIPEGSRELLDALTTLAWSSKHLQSEVTQPWQVKPMLAMLETLCGSLGAHRARPRMSFICCTTSPLSIDAQLLDATIGIARHGAPVLIYPMPIAGATSPVSVAGTVVMNIAEFLGIATVFALAAPDAPLMMGAGTSLLDMRTTAFSFGALETALMCVACVEVGHELGVPVLAPGLATDAKYGGIQAGFEKALKGLAIASAGADLITGGIGLLSGAGIMSLPQVIIDAEIATMIRRLLDVTEISPETLMGESISRVGFHGNYLKEKETARRLRRGEQFLPAIATRLSLEAWQASGKDELAVASEQVHDIVRLAEERGPRLAPDTLAGLNGIIDEAISALH